jgi:hypothetical protein
MPIYSDDLRKLDDIRNRIIDSRSEKAESRDRYTTTKAFLAFGSEASSNHIRIETGAVIFADPDYWQRKGRELQFWCGPNLYRVDRKIFLSSTKLDRESVHGKL